MERERKRERECVCGGERGPGAYVKEGRRLLQTTPFSSHFSYKPQPFDFSRYVYRVAGTRISNSIPGIALTTLESGPG